METYKCIIVVPTHSSYLDICKNFIELLRINWMNCNYDIVLSITGEELNVEGINSIYNGKDATLPECILNVAHEYAADYYFCFLGDAFICDVINQEEVDQCLKEINDFKINYCRLQPKACVKDRQDIGKILRRINVQERYAHSFIAFIATRKFVYEEFGERITDRDFELRYLGTKFMNDQSVFYSDRAILRKNIFNILPGIEKGKWNGIILRKLKRRYPGIKFAERELISESRALFLMFERRIYNYIPDRIRKYSKNILMPILQEWFDTEG